MYNVIIDGLFTEGKLGYAYDLYCDMLHGGISPDVITYNSLIGEFCFVN
jgi:pentatricopeptide repeat protein